VTRWQFWDVAHWDPTCAVFIFEHVVKPAVLKSGEPGGFVQRSQRGHIQVPGGPVCPGLAM
jgi:hypothetical protein